MKKSIVWLVIVLVLVVLLGIYISQKEKVEVEDALSVDSFPSERLPLAALEDGSYELDTKESKITWTGRRDILKTEHIGTLDLSSGNLTVAGSVIQSGEFTIDMTTLTDDGSGVGKHLMSDDFFSVEAYPESKFVLTGVEDGVVTGNLTMKDATRSISFPAHLTEEDGRYKASAKFVIDRTKWGVNWGSGSFFDDLGDKAISDMAEVELLLYTAS